MSGAIGLTSRLGHEPERDVGAATSNHCGTASRNRGGKRLRCHSPRGGHPAPTRKTYALSTRIATRRGFRSLVVNRCDGSDQVPSTNRLPPPGFEFSATSATRLGVSEAVRPSSSSSVWVCVKVCEPLRGRASGGVRGCPTQPRCTAAPVSSVLGVVDGRPGTFRSQRSVGDK